MKKVIPITHQRSFDLSPEIKNCRYDGCKNTLLATSEFNLCEVCRALSLRNSVAIMLEPTTPFIERRNEVMDQMIHNMRPDEILNWAHKMEWTYLELRKQISGREMDSYRKAKFDEALGSLNEKREAPKTPKAEKKRATRKENLTNLLGSKDAVKNLLGEDFSEL